MIFGVRTTLYWCDACGEQSPEYGKYCDLCGALRPQTPTHTLTGGPPQRVNDENVERAVEKERVRPDDTDKMGDAVIASVEILEGGKRVAFKLKNVPDDYSNVWLSASHLPMFEDIEKNE